MPFPSSGPSRATTGPGKTLWRGLIIPHFVCLEIETPKASRGRKRGERCPRTIRLGVRGSVVSSPAGSAAEPRPKMDFMHILGQKEAIWNAIFSIFERRRGPQTSRGPGKLPPPDGPALPSSPLSIPFLLLEIRPLKYS